MPYLQQLGANLEVKAELILGLKQGLKKMMKSNQIFVKYLLEGFIAELKLKFNSGLAKQIFNVLLLLFQAKLQKSKAFKKEFQQTMTFPLLLKASKFHLIFKNMDDVEKFLRSMGLEELATE